LRSGFLVHLLLNSAFAISFWFGEDTACIFVYYGVDEQSGVTERQARLIARFVTLLKPGRWHYPYSGMIYYFFICWKVSAKHPLDLRIAPTMRWTALQF